MSLAASGPIELAAAFPRMTEAGDVLHVTDLSLDDMANALAATTPALLAYAPGNGGVAGPLRGTVAITELGREVLAGRADRVAMAGIDRWLGGVHLRGHVVWRWDDERQAMAGPR